MTTRTAVAALVIGAGLLATGPTWAELVCVTPSADSALARLRAARQVAVAKVESDEVNSSQDGSTYKVVVVRSYKGGARVLWVSRTYCEDCGSLQIADYVLAFGDGERFSFSDYCHAPQTVRAAETQRAITILDRQRHFPRYLCRRQR
jgi:hypothetical protein